MYVNYHKHTHYSNLYIIDTHIKPEAYMKRAVELGQKTYFTTEHGWVGDIFEAKTLCDKYGLKCVVGMEGYIVPNALAKDNSNRHIVLIPRNDEARKKLNLISTHANKEGYYYKPRIFIEDLLKCDKNDFYITTACIAGIISTKEALDGIFKPLYEHFKENLFLEVQDHNHEKQKEQNKLAIKLAQKLGLRLIHANDSHYIYPQDAEDRQILLKGKKIEYSDEDTFILDYPDEDTIYKRYEIQGVLTKEQIKEALDTTLLFENIDNLHIDKEIKMPNIYPELSVDGRVEKLKKMICDNFKKVVIEDEIPKEKLPLYKEEIRKEMDIIEKTKSIHMMDYFLLNEKIFNLAINKYNGVLTTTGRGSAGGFYINRVLNMTQMDKVSSPIPLYPERFISVARNLENRSLADYDANVESPEPFIKAAKELLGENGCRWMIAYGTMQEGEAFRNLCRAKGLDFEEFNEVAKELDNYREDAKWKPIIEECQKFVDVIVSASVHPCSNLIMSGDIEKELGTIKSGEFPCAPITSGEADEWKYLKDDFLTVVTVSITKKVFDLINIPRYTVKQLEDRLDDKTWDIYAKGLTCTVNQVDSDWATNLVKTYKPKSVRELAMFVAALRPSFDSYRNGFINRIPFNNYSPVIDKVLENTDHYVLYQENLMQFFEFLGIEPAHSIGLIKKISKKKIKPEDFDSLTVTLKENWIKKTGNEYGFKETWDKMQAAMSYGFCSAHASCTALDSLYNAYLKAHYPLEYYTIVMDMYKDDAERTARLTKELEYFHISLNSPSFGKSKSEYTLDRTTNSIYKGLASIKFLNSQVSNELYDLSQKNTYADFPTLLKDIHEKTSINSKQLNILILLDFFKQFGNSEKLLVYTQVYDKLNGKKTIKKVDESSDIGNNIVLPIFNNKTIIIPLDQLSKYCQKETAKQYSQFDSETFLRDYWTTIPNKLLPLDVRLVAQKTYLGYITYTSPKLKDVYMITKFETPYGKSKPLLELYSLEKGSTIKCKVKDSNYFDLYPLKENSIFQLELLEQRYKNKKEAYTQGAEGWSQKEINMGYRWVKSTTETEWILSKWKLIK